MKGGLLVGGRPTTGAPLVIDEERQRRLDLFAAAALTGMLMNEGCNGEIRATLTAAAWRLAQAMLDNEPKEKQPDFMAEELSKVSASFGNRMLEDVTQEEREKNEPKGD